MLKTGSTKVATVFRLQFHALFPRWNGDVESISWYTHVAVDSLGTGPVAAASPQPTGMLQHLLDAWPAQKIHPAKLSFHLIVI